MFYLRRELSLFLSFAAFAAILPAPRPAAAQDLVATEDVAGGSSVFVFRESRKKPQAHAGGGRVFSREGTGGGASGAAGRARTSRTNSQIASLAAKRRADAQKRRAAAIAAANRKAALSNTLTAKAEGYLDNSQTDLAITNYRAALVQNPKNKRASDGLSNALMSKGIDVAGENNSEAAIPLFEEAAKYDKQNDVAYAKLGAIYDANGKADQAIVNYEKAVQINPEYSQLYAPLGLAYIDKGEIAKGGSALLRSDAAAVDNV
jgi:tetratricopeptide (TPR) repeat protein